MSVEAIAGRGCSTEGLAGPEWVTVGAGPVERHGGATSRELLTLVDPLVGSGRLMLRAVWPGFELEVAESPANPGLWGAQAFSSPALGGAVLQGVAEGCVAALEGLAENDWAVWGGVTVDHGRPYFTPYESFFPIGWERGERSAAEHPRGYYWANLLTAAHVQQLGGIDAVAEYCDAHGLAVTGYREGKAAVLRCPRGALDLGDEALGAVHRLLDPILLHEPYRWYADWPLRVFKEPGTAFRRIEPTFQAHLPAAFDDDEPVPDGDDW
ncbi:MAG: hypothetical protein HOW97_41780 [Catenulispora sp.]|nr:hypothetical protein [Catenulispora sp.]